MRSYILVNMTKIFELSRGDHVCTIKDHYLVPVEFEKELMKVLIERSDDDVSDWFNQNEFEELVDLDWDSGFIVTKQLYEKITLIHTGNHC